MCHYLCIDSTSWQCLASDTAFCSGQWSFLFWVFIISSLESDAFLSAFELRHARCDDLTFRSGHSIHQYVEFYPSTAWLNICSYQNITFWTQCLRMIFLEKLSTTIFLVNWAELAETSPYTSSRTRTTSSELSAWLDTHQPDNGLLHCRVVWFHVLF